MRATYGGRKNCSSDTYMPRNISMSRKYLPARSNAPSPSSHRLGFGNRKPGGGGPAGVAARERVVEKKATVAGEGRRPDAKCGDRSSVAAGRLRANIVNGFALAMVSVLRSRAGRVLLSVCGGCRQARNLRSSLVTRRLRLADKCNDGNDDWEATRMSDICNRRYSSVCQAVSHLSPTVITGVGCS